MDKVSSHDNTPGGVTDHDFEADTPSLKKAESLVLLILKGHTEAIIKFRKLYWLIFSGLIIDEDINKWIELLIKSRQQYNNLLKKHVEKEPSQLKLRDPNFFHPLSSHTLDSISNKTKNNELREEIWKDVTRTFPEFALFQTTRIQEMLLRLLLTWSLENPEISYKQGMNELMGFFLLICYTDRYKGNDAKSTCSLLCAEDFIEPDTYALFSRLMDLGMKPMFDPNPIQSKKVENSRTKINLSENLSLFHTPVLQRNDNPISPILALCDYIFHTVLYQVEPTLYRHLKSLDLEPQLFLLRWIRLMFSREFHLSHTISIWDAIFADYFRRNMTDEIVRKTRGPNLELCKNLEMVIYFSISMLKFVKYNLLESDVSGCLKRLLRYPPMESISLFVQSALETRKEFESEIFPALDYNKKVNKLPIANNTITYKTQSKSSEVVTKGIKKDTASCKSSHTIECLCSILIYSVYIHLLLIGGFTTGYPSYYNNHSMHQFKRTNNISKSTQDNLSELPLLELARHASQLKSFVRDNLTLQACDLLKDELELVQHDLSMLSKILKGELPYDPELFVITSEDL